MKLRSLSILGFLFVVAFSSGAWADNTTCAAATLVVPDGSTHEGALSAGTVRWYRFVAKAGRSYALMLENLSAADEQPSIGITEVVSACGGAPIAANDFADVQEPVSMDPSFTVGASRQALQAASDGVLFFPVQDLNTSNAARFRVRVEETTLFNPLWSTSGVETRYRLFNTTNRPCRVTLDLRTDSNGIPSGGSNTATFSLAANSSVTRHTGAGDLNLQNGQVGHATLAHDCTPGAILVDAFLTSPSREIPVTFTTARQQR